MYEQVFNLTARPFTSIHYVKHYFPAAAIDQSLQQTKMIVERGSGPVVVVGGHGTGKTLFLACLEECFNSQFRIVNISASLLRSREDLLQNVLFQLQMNCRGLGENEMRLDLVEMLKNDQSSGILLMIDDAQKLSVESVEEMQLLTDFILNGQPRVRLVLAGSQGIEERLADTRLISFNQRIAGRFFISALSSTEVEQYVRAHLERAGGKPDELFSADSYRAVYEVTEGCPRYINQVCDHAMIFAATRGIVPVTDSLVREAWYDIQKLPGSVAPSGSGASMSDSPVAVQTVETDSEGWTVLEFGELSDAESDSMQPVAEVVDEDVVAESDETPEEVFIDTMITEVEAEEIEEPVVAKQPAEEQPAAENVVEQVVVAEDEQQTPEPIPGPSFSVDPSGAVKTTQISDDVEQQPPAATVPDVMGGAAILASAMAGFGVATGTDPDPAPEADTFVEPENAVEPPAVEVLDSAIQQSDEQSEISAEQEDVTDVQSLEQDQTVADVQQDVQPEPAVQSPVFEDPFAADDFENEEEVLANAYSPFVAQQNQRSLEVTSEHLQNLTPGESVEWNEAAGSSDSEPVEEETFPTFETAIASPEPIRETQKQPLDPRETVETRIESGLLEPSSLSDEFAVSREAVFASNGMDGVEEIVSSVELEPVEANPGSGYVPLDPDVSLVSEAPELPHLVDSTPLDQSSVTEPVPVVEEVSAEQAEVQEPAPETSIPETVAPETFVQQIPTPSVEVAEAQVPETTAAADPNLGSEPSVASEPNSKFHEQAASPDDPEIRRQAEAIIRSLGANFEVSKVEVSHETPVVPISIEEETNAIEASIQQSAESQPTQESDAVAEPTSAVVMPNLDEIKNALRQAQDGLGYPATTDNTQQTPTAAVGQIPVQMAGVDPVGAEQEILNEVREQSSFVAGTVMPQEPNQPGSNQPLAGEDDRAILDVNSVQTDVPQPAAAIETPLPAWSQQEPSQGEAARIDYQRLFDQLRNVQGNQE